MDATAIILEKPRHLALRPLAMTPLGPSDLLIEAWWSGVSTGTEKLLWTGRMPSFPGMGYPLVPGYETVGQVVDAGCDVRARVGEQVFVPGAACWRDAHSLFGGTASRLIAPSARVLAIPATLGRSGILLALAATAHHALAGSAAPELVIGHGILGRLLARVAAARGDGAPVVWETNAVRRDGAGVVDPADDPRADYRTIVDASGDPAILDAAIPRLARGGEIVLAGFYDMPLTFAFPPAFRREARIRVAAEFAPADMHAVLALVADGRLALDGLVSHVRPAAEAGEAYPQAFEDSACLKMVLDWKGHA